MIEIDTDAPIAHLRRLAGLSVRALARELGLSVHNAVTSAEAAGEGVSLRTLRRYAQACGYEVLITLKRLPKP